MLEHGLCGREGDLSRLLKRSRGLYVRLTKLTASHQLHENRGTLGRKHAFIIILPPPHVVLLRHCFPLPPSSSSSSSSSERYPTARTAAATGRDHSGASLATRYRTQSMRISLHHSIMLSCERERKLHATRYRTQSMRISLHRYIMSSCERERKLHACWERWPMRSDPVLIDPAPSLRPSRWILCDLGARGGSRAKHTEGEETREKW